MNTNLSTAIPRKKLPRKKNPTRSLTRNHSLKKTPRNSKKSSTNRTSKKNTPSPRKKSLTTLPNQKTNRKKNLMIRRAGRMMLLVEGPEVTTVPVTASEATD